MKFFPVYTYLTLQIFVNMYKDFIYVIFLKYIFLFFLFLKNKIKQEN